MENNYRIEVKITFMLIAYLVLLCEFFWEFSIFQFCRPLVDIYWHPLLRKQKFRKSTLDKVKTLLITYDIWKSQMTNLRQITIFCSTIFIIWDFWWFKMLEFKFGFVSAHLFTHAHLFISLRTEIKFWHRHNVIYVKA